MEGDGLGQVAAWPAVHGTRVSLALKGRCLHVAYIAAALRTLRVDTLEASSSVDACGPPGAHVLWACTLINILTALPISQDPVSTRAGTSVGTRGVHTGMHAEPGASFLPIDLTLIHISLGLMLTAVPSFSWRTDASVVVDAFHTRPSIVTRLAGAFTDISAAGLLSCPATISKTHHAAGPNQLEPRVAGKIDFMVH